MSPSPESKNQREQKAKSQGTAGDDAGNPAFSPGPRQAELRKQVLSAVATLDTTSQAVLEGLFALKSGEPKSPVEVGGELGITEENVEAVKADALRRLMGYGRRGKQEGSGAAELH